MSSETRACSRWEKQVGSPRRVPCPDRSKTVHTVHGGSFGDVTSVVKQDVFFAVVRRGRAGEGKSKSSVEDLRLFANRAFTRLGVAGQWRWDERACAWLTIPQGIIENKTKKTACVVQSNTKAQVRVKRCGRGRGRSSRGRSKDVGGSMVDCAHPSSVADGEWGRMKERL